jgi:hypothetical protein
MDVRCATIGLEATSDARGESCAFGSTVTGKGRAVILLLYRVFLVLGARRVARISDCQRTALVYTVTVSCAEHGKDRRTTRRKGLRSHTNGGRFSRHGVHHCCSNGAQRCHRILMAVLQVC